MSRRPLGAPSDQRAAGGTGLLALALVTLPLQEAAPAPTRELAIRAIFDVIGPDGPATAFEPSGLTRHDGAWLVVGDTKATRGVYRLVATEPLVASKPGVAAETGTGRAGWRAVPLSLPDVPSERYDFEGVDVTGQRVFVLDERGSTLASIAFEGEAAWEAWKIPIDPAHKNGGLEGLAVRPDGKLAYVVQQRGPRRLLALNLEQRTIAWTRDHDDARNDADLEPDFNGLCLEGDVLFALSCDTWSVRKLDARSGADLGGVVFPRLEHDEFRTTARGGFAEGLHVTEHSIWILYDNGQSPRRSGPASFASLLVEFERPEGF